MWISCTLIISLYHIYILDILEDHYSLIPLKFLTLSHNSQVPKQNNTSDCGCFTIEYIESFCESSDSLLDSLPDNIEHTTLFHSKLGSLRRDLLIHFILSVKNKTPVEQAAREMQERRISFKHDLEGKKDELRFNWEAFRQYMTKNELNEVEQGSPLQHDKMHQFMFTQLEQIFHSSIAHLYNPEEYSQQMEPEPEGEDYEEEEGGLEESPSQ